jgi:hypothetical protein
MKMRACLAAASITVVSSSALPTAKPKILALAQCPAWGAEKRGSTRGLLNEVKHHAPPAGIPTLLTFADVMTLQRLADARVNSGAGAKVLATDRQKLQGLETQSGRVGEGDLVAIVGFIVGKPSANAGESANCYLSGAPNNDFEFKLAPSADATPYDAIVAEMIPQDRPALWTIGRLRRLSRDHRQVLVVGQLMLDTRHVPNPTRGTNHESPRASTWEIHPVTKMLVCPQPAGGCDPRREDPWQPIEAVAEKQPLG